MSAYYNEHDPFAAGWLRELKAQHKNGNGFGLTLGMAATLTGWPTPNTPSGGRSVSIEKMDATGRTATVNDATGSDYAYSSGNHDKPVLKLPGAAKLSAGISAATGSTGRSRLNPRFSLWLMGYPPAEWVSCGERVTRSTRGSRRK